MVHKQLYRPRLGIFAGRIVFDAVRFAYPSRPDDPVLKGLSLTVEPGQCVALVGPSGGGKSTLVSLIERFYLPTAGRLTVDGMDLSTVDPSWLRRHMALVSQEPVLFDGTIEYNICYGRADQLDDAALRKVAAMANVDSFVREFGEGYKTRVGALPPSPRAISGPEPTLGVYTVL